MIQRDKSVIVKRWPQKNGIDALAILAIIILNILVVCGRLARVRCFSRKNALSHFTHIVSWTIVQYFCDNLPETNGNYARAKPERVRNSLQKSICAVLVDNDGHDFSGETLHTAD
jgi:hypothetical protein